MLGAWAVVEPVDEPALDFSLRRIGEATPEVLPHDGFCRLVRSKAIFIRDITAGSRIGPFMDCVWKVLRGESLAPEGVQQKSLALKGESPALRGKPLALEGVSLAPPGLPLRQLPQLGTPGILPQREAQKGCGRCPDP
jgi:hypothetical protein